MILIFTIHGLIDGCIIHVIKILLFAIKINIHLVFHKNRDNVHLVLYSYGHIFSVQLVKLGVDPNSVVFYTEWFSHIVVGIYTVNNYSLSTRICIMVVIFVCPNVPTLFEAYIECVRWCSDIIN